MLAAIIHFFQEGRLDPEELRQRRKGLAGVLERKNAGVVERDTRDRLELKVGDV